MEFILGMNSGTHYNTGEKVEIVKKSGLFIILLTCLFVYLQGRAEGWHSIHALESELSAAQSDVIFLRLGDYGGCPRKMPCM